MSWANGKGARPEWRKDEEDEEEGPRFAPSRVPVEWPFSAHRTHRPTGTGVASSKGLAVSFSSPLATEFARGRRTQTMMP